jgi:hypothetical protein
MGPYRSLAAVHRKPRSDPELQSPAIASTPRRPPPCSPPAISTCGTATR